MRKLNKAVDEKGSAEFGTRNAEWKRKERNMIIFATSIITSGILLLIQHIPQFESLEIFFDVIIFILFVISIIFFTNIDKEKKWVNACSILEPFLLLFYIVSPIIGYQKDNKNGGNFQEILRSPEFRFLLCSLFILICKFVIYKKDQQLIKHKNKNISYMLVNTYAQSLTNYIRLCFSPKKWNKDTEQITESMMQYVLTVKNPQNKEAFLKACLEMSEDLSGYPLKHKSYACNPVCKNLQLIPEEKLHSTFQEIHSILKERKENYEPF